MKTHKILTAVCCLLTLAVCSQAQVVMPKANSKQQSQIDKVLQKSVMQARAARQAKCYKCGNVILDKYHQECAKGGICQQAPAAARKAAKLSPYTGKDPHTKVAAQQAETKNVCAACGEEIHSAGQHCAATGYTTLCSASSEEPAAQNVQEDSAVCPKCGKALSIDERYHGVKHECKAAAKAANACAACGEEVRPGQHCAATGYTTLCSSSKQETKYQPVENNYNGGDPHANEVF